MKFKKITALVLGVAMLAVCTATACSNKGGNEQVNGDGLIVVGSPWWSSTSSMEYDGEKPVFNNVSIDLLTVVTGDDETPFRQIVSDFNNEYSGQIHINVESLAQSGFEKTAAQRISTNANAPDLMMCHSKSHKYFGSKKLIQPMNEGYDAAKIEYDASDYVAQLTSLTNLGYADYNFQVPIDMQSMVIYYNKVILGELGKEIPKTHEELIDVCRAFKQKYTSSDYYPVSCGTTDIEYFQKYLFLTMYVQNGGELYNPATLRAEWDKGDNLEAFKAADRAIKDLTENNYFKYGENVMTAETRFFTNKSLFLIDRPWYSQSLFKGYTTNNPGVEDINEYIGGASVAGLFAMDQTKDCAQNVFGDSHAFIMPVTVKDVEVKAAIAVFTDWFTHNADAGTDWGEAGHMSASKVIYNSAEYNQSAYIDTFMNGFYSSPDNFVTLGSTVHYAELIDKLYTVAVRCLTAPESIETIVQVMAQNFNEYLELAAL